MDMVAPLVPHGVLALVLDPVLAPTLVLDLDLDLGLDLALTPKAATLALPLQTLTHGLDLVLTPKADTLALLLQTPTHGLDLVLTPTLGLDLPPHRQAPGPLKTAVAPGKREVTVLDPVLDLDLVLDTVLDLVLAPLPHGDNRQTTDGPQAHKDVVVTLVDGVVELLDGDHLLPTTKVGE